MIKLYFKITDRGTHVDIACDGKGLANERERIVATTIQETVDKAVATLQIKLNEQKEAAETMHLVNQTQEVKA
jgi:hypothetical protein